MSLQVWLPLTKDLRQQGINRSTISGNNVTISSGGKLGNCYSFNGNNSYLLSNSSPFSNSTDNWSYACWFKPNNQHQGCLFSCRTGTNSTGMTIFYYNTQILFDDGTRWQFTPSTAITTGAWNHLVFVRKKGVGKYCYLNGRLIGSTSTTGTQTTVGANYAIGNSQSANTSLSGNPLNGYLNDVRIYDHALSQMEVKELAKGLVLHYPLNRQGWGQENLGNFASIKSNWTMDGLTGSDYSDSTYGNVIKLVTSSTNQRMYNYVPTTMWQSGKVYTVSFLAKADTNTRTCDMSRSIADFSPSFTLSTNWKRYSGKITSTSTPNGGTLSFRIHQSGATVYITRIKVEEGEIVTPYCPGSGDAAYTTMGLNDTTEYDCSGFCNNGTRTGTFTWTSDTPKYAVSTAFSGSQYITEGNEIETTDSTITVWVKTSLSANAFILDCRNSSGAGKQPIYQYTNGSIQSGGASQYVTTNTGLLVANTWIHLAIVQSGNSLLIYKNGSLFQTLSCTNSLIIKPTIGARYSLSSLLPSGSLSDLRIYATALSADDVKSLYQNSAYIDDSGNIHGQIH